ncbi:MAG: hypothetical protein AAFV43_04785 [Planctomycetota bacterium]
MPTDDRSGALNGAADSHTGDNSRGVVWQARPMMRAIAMPQAIRSLILVPMFAVGLYYMRATDDAGLDGIVDDQLFPFRLFFAAITAWLAVAPLVVMAAALRTSYTITDRSVRVESTAWPRIIEAREYQLPISSQSFVRRDFFWYDIILEMEDFEDTGGNKRQRGHGLVALSREDAKAACKALGLPTTRI